MSNDPRRFVETYDVQRPTGIIGQRDQMVQAVTAEHPEAQLSSVEAGLATFFTRTEMIVASYEDSSRLLVDGEFDQAQASNMPL